MRQELRKILARVFVALLIFLIGVVIYKQGNPYAYPGLENRILFVLVPSGIVLLYLYLEERENRNRLFSVIMVTISRLHESKFMRFCEGIWERSPSLIRTRVSKVLAVLYTYLHKMSGYMLKQDPKEVVSHVFLGMLLIVALQSIFPQPPLEWAKTPVMIAAVTLGVITFYLNRDKLGEIEDEARQEEIEENLREMEFGEKYPRINQIWGVRWVVRWMNKEGWWYSGGLIITFILSIALYSYNLGSYEFREDEFQVVGAAAGYYYDQSFYVWDWLNNELGEHAYTRAWPHTWLIAQSYKYLGISEWSSRIVSILFGFIFILESYFIIKFFTHNKLTSIVITMIFLFYTPYINMFRYIRMYALLTPIFFILVYLGYRWISETNDHTIINNKITLIFKRNFDFNYSCLTIFLIILVFGYFVHMNIFVILPSLFIFFIYRAFLKKERKYIFTSILGVLGAIIVVLLALFTNILAEFMYFITFFERRNYVYLELLTNYPFPYEIGVVFLATLLIGMFFLNKSELKNKIVYLFMFLIFSLPFFVFVADRYSGFLYVSHLITISILLISVAFFWLVRLFANKYVRTALLMVLILSTGLSFYDGFERLYGDDNGYGTFTTAYQTIINNYNPENEVVFGQYLRTYYIRDIRQDMKFINMLSNGKYSLEQFRCDSKKYGGGWITWETRKSYHVHKDLREYIDKNFIKYHGKGIDNTNVEVYYFNQSMVK